ncbi:MAG: hypothetical protein QXR16_03530 [Candidatus Micrarchaeaceae archaeon]
MVWTKVTKRELASMIEGSLSIQMRPTAPEMLGGSPAILSAIIPIESNISLKEINRMLSESFCKPQSCNDIGGYLAALPGSLLEIARPSASFVFDLMVEQRLPKRDATFVIAEAVEFFDGNGLAINRPALRFFNSGLRAPDFKKKISYALTFAGLIRDSEQHIAAIPKRPE